MVLKVSSMLLTSVETYGGGGYPTTLADFDTIVSRLDKQGSIEENVIFVDR